MNTHHETTASRTRSIGGLKCTRERPRPEEDWYASDSARNSSTVTEPDDRTEKVLFSDCP